MLEPVRARQPIVEHVDVEVVYPVENPHRVGEHVDVLLPGSDGITGVFILTEQKPPVIGEGQNLDLVRLQLGELAE